VPVPLRLLGLNTRHKILVIGSIAEQRPICITIVHMNFAESKLTINPSSVEPPDNEEKDLRPPITLRPGFLVFGILIERMPDDRLFTSTGGWVTRRFLPAEPDGRHSVLSPDECFYTPREGAPISGPQRLAGGSARSRGSLPG